MSRELLKRFALAAQIFAEATPTKVDDQLANLLLYVADNPNVYFWIMSLVPSFGKKSLRLPSSFEDEMIPDDVKKKLKLGGFDFAKFGGNLTRILHIMALLMGEVKK